MWSGRQACVQTLCARWRGSNEEVYEFAQETALAAVTGDAVVAMLPLAHFEIAARRTMADEQTSRPAGRAVPLQPPGGPARSWPRPPTGG